jgi:hypothetical protein
VRVEANQHLSKPVRIGRVNGDGLFDLVQEITHQVLAVFAF